MFKDYRIQNVANYLISFCFKTSIRCFAKTYIYIMLSKGMNPIFSLLVEIRKYFFEPSKRERGRRKERLCKFKR